MSVSEGLVRRLFGDMDIPETVVLTPMSRIYNLLTALYQNPEESRGGWYRGALLPGKRAAVVKVHPGSAIIDVVHVLGTQAKRLIYLGYCGGLNGIGVGDIVLGTQAEHVSQKGLPEYCRFTELPPVFENHKSGPVITVNSMILEENPDSMNGYSAVDLETYWVYRYSAAPAISVMLATDKPNHEMFYEIDPSDPRVEKGLLRLNSVSSHLLEAFGVANGLG